MDYDNQRLNDKLEILEKENRNLNSEIERISLKMRDYEKEQYEFENLKRESIHFRKEDFNQLVKENQKLVSERDDLKKSLNQTRLRID